MTVSRTWALICALFTPNPTKGAFNLELANDATGAGSASLVADASTTAVSADTAGTAAAAAPAAAADTASAVLIPGNTAGPAAVSALAEPSLVGLVIGGPSAADSGAVAVLDADDENETGEELESLKAIAGGGVDLFVTVLKDLVSFAMDLGHDFDSAYDKSVARAKALAAKL